METIIFQIDSNDTPEDQTAKTVMFANKTAKIDTERKKPKK